MPDIKSPKLILPSRWKATKERHLDETPQDTHAVFYNPPEVSPGPPTTVRYFVNLLVNADKLEARGMRTIARGSRDKCKALAHELHTQSQNSAPTSLN